MESFTTHIAIRMRPRKRLALIAHDNRKEDLLEWARFNHLTLAKHDLSATGTTGALLASDLDLPVTRFRSGPLGGDQQVGAKIAEGEIDFVIVFWDPLEPHPHDVDVKALLRIAVVYNVPIACNRSSADFMISSPLVVGEYDRAVAGYCEGRSMDRGFQLPEHAAAAGNVGVFLTQLVGEMDAQPRSAGWADGSVFDDQGLNR